MRPSVSRVLEFRRDDPTAFFEAPYGAYGDDPRFVQPLRGDLMRLVDARKNPLFAQGAPRELWTAHRDGVAIGRIICHVHPASNARHGWRRAYFGMFDAPDDLTVAAGLLHRSESFARAQGCDTLMGNFNLTAMQMIGVVTEGFEHGAYADQVWNPAHIPRLLTANGYKATFGMRTFEVELARVPLEELEAHFVHTMEPEFTWRSLSKRTLPRQLEEIRAILNDSFDRNPMFVPLTPEEMQFQTDGLSHVIDPAITRLVHDASGPAGVMVCIPDLNPFFRATRSRLGWRTLPAFWRLKTRRDRAVVVFGGVVQRHQGRKIAGAIITVVARALRERGYRTLGVTWISDDNKASLAQMRRLRATPMHRTMLFQKTITP